MKKKLIGYFIKNERGDVLQELLGTQPRRTLNKFRKTHFVRKMYANRKGELVA